MKLDRPKIPFKPKEDEKVFSANIPRMASEDVAKVMEFIQQNKETELKELINSRMAPYEKEFAEGGAGLATRDYLTALLGETIMKKHPEYEGIAFHHPSMMKEHLSKFRDQFYPGLKEGLKSMGMSDELTLDPFEGPQYSPDKGLNMNPNITSTAKLLGVMGHELGHATDFLGQKANANLKYYPDEPQAEVTKKVLANLLKLKPENKQALGDSENTHRDTTSSESGYNNPVIPNFKDYNWEEGDFNSDYMRDPLDIQSEVGEDHHHDRNYPYENLFNMVKKDKLVEAKPRFNKLNKLLT